MSVAAPPFTLVNYQTRLPSFEGPLDLLLRLIERQKLDITDVSLVAVTDQFLSFVAEMDDAPLEVIAEFTSVGTRLTLLKSRSLLPKPPALAEDETPDPDDLVEQLRAYKRLKNVAADLGRRRDDDLVSYAHRGTGPIARRTEIAPPKLAHYEPLVLVRALRRRLSTIPSVIQTIRQRRIVSIREMTDRVLEMLGHVPTLPFSHVVEGYGTRSETATAFLAMLVLIRRRSIDAEQSGLFQEISLSTAHHDVTDGPDDMGGEDEFLN